MSFILLLYFLAIISLFIEKKQTNKPKQQNNIKKYISVSTSYGGAIKFHMNILAGETHCQ